MRRRRPCILCCGSGKTSSPIAGVLSLPALPRMLYVVRGAAMAGTRPIAQGEAWHGEDAVTVRASEAGATIWRWDLSTGTPGAWRNGPA